MGVLERLGLRQAATVPDPVSERDAMLRDHGERFMHFTESLRESGLTWTDLLLGLDTVGFERMGDISGLADVTEERRATVLRSRLYWRHEPLADRTIQVWTDFAFGAEWQVEAPGEASELQRVVDDVWKARHNQRRFSREGLRRSSDALLVDGERFFAYFTGTGPRSSRIAVRCFDPLEIAEVLTNPDDQDEVWYYRRTWTDGLSRKRFTRFYRDWDFVTADGTPRNDPHPRMRADVPDAGALGDVRFVPEPGVWMSYVAFNTIDMRGWPLLTSALDWIREHREYMADRAVVSHARASFAAKAKVKGDQSSVNKLRSAFEAPDPTNPQTGFRPIRGRTFVGNEGVDYDLIDGARDGASAQHDQRAFRSMAITPSGVPEYLLGDSSTANLATARATERPMELSFGAYQGVWVDYYTDLFDHAARWMGVAAGDASVAIDPPNILARDVPAVMGSIADLVRAIPSLAQSPDLVRMVLTDIGVDDVEAAMEQIEPALAATAAPAQQQPGPGQDREPPADNDGEERDGE